MADVVLEVNNLVKDYGKFRAVDGISFKVPKGKIIGLLGPNGAGKTTTIQILLGITLLTTGDIKYFGKDFKKHKQEVLKRINYASAFNALMGRISVKQNLIVFADLYGVNNPDKKIKELVEYFEINHILNSRYHDLSSGQKTRVNLVKSLLNDPDLILMDEPTASLDPDIADKMLTLIEDLKKSRGLTILYTSHDMNEVTRICDEVIFLDHGKIVAHDTPLGLTKKIKESELKIMFSGKKEDVEKVLKSSQESFKFLDQQTVVVKTDEKLIPKVILEVGKSNVEITDLEIKKPSLEDVFLTIARKEQHAV